MATLSEKIEKAVLISCDKKWRKVAMIIGRVLDEYESDTTADEIASVIEQLIAAGKIEAVGNTKNWRASEVRLTE